MTHPHDITHPLITNPRIPHPLIPHLLISHLLSNLIPPMQSHPTDALTAIVPLLTHPPISPLITHLLSNLSSYRCIDGDRGPTRSRDEIAESTVRGSYEGVATTTRSTGKGSNPSYQYILETNLINTPYQYTLLPHLFNTPFHLPPPFSPSL